MRLMTQTDYAIRTLMFLTTRSGRTTIPQIADLFGISVHHVAKVANVLARKGYVRSIRGVGGGLELAREPEDISLGDVIQCIEGSTHLLECVDTDNVCTIQSFCKLKGALAEAERVQMAFLNEVTLRDVAPTKRQLIGVETK